MENETMRFLMETGAIRDNKGATGRKLYLRYNSADFNVSSFLDHMLDLKAMLINLEIFTKEHHQL